MSGMSTYFEVGGYLLQTVRAYLVRRTDGTAVAVAVSHALTRGAVMADAVTADALQPVLHLFDQAGYLLRSCLTLHRARHLFPSWPRSAVLR